MRSDRVLSEITGLIACGELGPEARLPAERELAERLGTSRVTLREALRALQGAGLLAARRGSGIRVRPRRDWSLAALALLLAAGRPDGTAGEALRPLAVEALALRRSFARRLPGEVAGRLATGSLSAARRLAAEALAERGVPTRFVRLDATALGSALEAAGAPMAVCLWNDLGRVPEALACWMPGPAPAPSDYLDRQEALWDALETGDAVRAERLVGAHLARLDRGLLAAFGAESRGGGTG
jgi:DNA-binding FadR family transcriptional regulator